MNFLRLWYRRRKKNNGEEICICFDDIRAHFERFINNAQSFMRTKMRSPQTQFRNIQLNVGIRLITSLESNRILCGKRYTCVNKRINTIRYSRNNIPWMMRVAHLLHNIHFFNSFISVTFSSRKLTQFISSNWWFCLHLGVIWKANRKVTIRHRYPMHGLSQKPEIWKKKKKWAPKFHFHTNLQFANAIMQVEGCPKVGPTAVKAIDRRTEHVWMISLHITAFYLRSPKRPSTRMSLEPLCFCIMCWVDNCWYSFELVGGCVIR